MRTIHDEEDACKDASQRCMVGVELVVQDEEKHTRLGPRPPTHSVLSAEAFDWLQLQALARTHPLWQTATFDVGTTTASRDWTDTVRVVAEHSSGHTALTNMLSPPAHMTSTTPPPSSQPADPAPPLAALTLPSASTLHRDDASANTSPRPLTLAQRTPHTSKRTPQRTPCRLSS